MWANNEVGALQPLDEVVALARQYGVPVHADAVQAVGQVPVDFAASGLDALTLTGTRSAGRAASARCSPAAGSTLTPVLHGAGRSAACGPGRSTPRWSRRSRPPCRRRSRPRRSAARVGALRDELVAGVAPRPGCGAARPAGSGRAAARERALHVPRLRGRLAAVPAGLRRRRGLHGLGLPGGGAPAQPRAAGHGGRRARGAGRAAVQPRAHPTAADVDALLARAAGVVERARPPASGRRVGALMRVLAALSGGVDSAVAAARAVDAGHDVVGVHMALSRTRDQSAPARGAAARSRTPATPAAPPTCSASRTTSGTCRRSSRRPSWPTSSPSTPPAAPRTRACAATSTSSSRRCWTGRSRWVSTPCATGHYARIVDRPGGPRAAPRRRLWPRTRATCSR